MKTLRDFDHPDYLNGDGTVTLRMTPSAWHCYNISPDTYQTFTGNSWVESEMQYMSEELGRDVLYDEFTWTYDHAGIVREPGARSGRLDGRCAQ